MSHKAVKDDKRSASFVPAVLSSLIVRNRLTAQRPGMTPFPRAGEAGGSKNAPVQPAAKEIRRDKVKVVTACISFVC